MSYITALKTEYQAKKECKAGNNIHVGLMASIPVLKTSNWVWTMEACLFQGSQRVHKAVRAEYNALPIETQRALLSTPKYGGREWVERARFWKEILKPNLFLEDYQAAMADILRWYSHCVRRKMGEKAKRVFSA